MPYRYVCDVLEEQRKMYETRNFSGFLGSIEELQGMCNRMESKLREYNASAENKKYSKDIDKDIEAKAEQLRGLNKELDELRKQKSKLRDDLNALRHDWNKQTKGGTVIAKPLIGHCCNESMDGHRCVCEEKRNDMIEGR